MRKSRTPIPEFSSYKEAARFFDEHDTTKLELEEVGFGVFFDNPPGSKPTRKGKGVVHVPVAVEGRSLKRIVALARAEGKTPKEWLSALVRKAVASR